MALGGKVAESARMLPLSERPASHQLVGRVTAYLVKPTYVMRETVVITGSYILAHTFEAVK